MMIMSLTVFTLTGCTDAEEPAVEEPAVEMEADTVNGQAIKVDLTDRSYD